MGVDADNTEYTRLINEWNDKIWQTKCTIYF